jgi:hypothetical protein
MSGLVPSLAVHLCPRTPKSGVHGNSRPGVEGLGRSGQK